MVAKGFVILPAIVVVAWVSPMVIFRGIIAVALHMMFSHVLGFVSKAIPKMLSESEMYDLGGGCEHIYIYTSANPCIKCTG